MKISQDKISKWMDIIMGLCIVAAALVFWDAWCMMFYGIAIGTGDPSPQDFLNLNPIHHLREFLK